MASRDKPAGARVALYLRVSTDDQTIENQRIALAEVAAHRGWRIVARVRGIALRESAI